MPYNVYAAPIAVREEDRPTMIGLRYLTEKEAIESVWEFRRAGWFVYRVSGPNGYELSEKDVEELCGPLLEARKDSQKRR